MDLLIKNTRIITGDPADMDAGKGCIGITGGKISYIGTEEKPASDILDAKGMVSMPGLCNAHTHTSMVLMRNHLTDKPLEQWLKEGIFPIESKLTREHIRCGSQLAVAEMIRSGTTAFLDMYFNGDVTARVASQAGIRANIALGIFTSREAEHGIGQAKADWLEFNNKYKGAGGGLINTSLEVHSVYLYEEKALRDSAEFAMENGIRIHTHLHETRAEVENCRDKYGMTPIMKYLECGLLDVPVTAAHTVWITDEEMDLMLEKGVRPVHCASSNMFLGSGFAPIPRMLEKGLPVALGTDGAASNNDLDMLEEMAFAGLIHKGNNLDPTVVNSAQTIMMATSNGAAAIGFEESGMIKEGMNADIILVNTNTIHNMPLLNPVNAVVYSTKGSDVETVIVNGKILMENRELKTLDEEKIIYEAGKSSADLLNR